MLYNLGYLKLEGDYAAEYFYLENLVKLRVSELTYVGLINLIEAFETKIVHSLKLQKDIHTQLFLLTGSYEKLNP